MEENEREANFDSLFKDLSNREKFYNEQSKETLVNMLVLKDMLDESVDDEGRETGLWCYVADDTGIKYLSNALPKLMINCGVYYTDGEVNIRVPECMTSMFPDVKYGDEPVKVNISISF